MRGPAGGEHTTFWRAAPGRIPTQTAFSQSKRFETLDLDRAHGCIRDGAHAYSPEGGLAVLRGNLSPNGCVVKTAAVHAEMLRFSGTAIVFDSEVDAVAAMNDGRVKPGHVVTIRFEGPKGGPGMQEMAKVPMGLKARGLDRVVAVITDGRYSGSNSGLSVGHISPEAASGGAIALVRDGTSSTSTHPGARSPCGFQRKNWRGAARPKRPVAATPGPRRRGRARCPERWPMHC